MTQARTQVALMGKSGDLIYRYGPTKKIPLRDIASQLSQYRNMDRILNPRFWQCYIDLLLIVMLQSYDCATQKLQLLNCLT